MGPFTRQRRFQVRALVATASPHKADNRVRLSDLILSFPL